MTQRKIITRVSFIYLFIFFGGVEGGGQGLVQYHQNRSIEVKASNPLYKDDMIPKYRCFCDI